MDVRRHLTTAVLLLAAMGSAAPASASVGVRIGTTDSVPPPSNPVHMHGYGLWHNDARVWPAGTAWAKLDTQGLATTATDAVSAQGTLSFGARIIRPCAPFDTLDLGATLPARPVITLPTVVYGWAQGKASFNCSGVTRTFPYYVTAQMDAETLDPIERPDPPEDPSWAQRPQLPTIEGVRMTSGPGSNSYFSFSWENSDCDIPHTPGMISTYPHYCYLDVGPDEVDYTEIRTGIE